MHKEIVLTLLLVAIVCAVKKDIFRSDVSFIPEDWSPKRPAGNSDRVTLYIGAKQQNLNKLEVSCYCFDHVWN